MPLYNVCTEYGQGGRMCRVYSFNAPDDGAAEQFVIDRITDRAVELWCYSRKVAGFQGKQLGPEVSPR